MSIGLHCTVVPAGVAQRAIAAAQRNQARGECGQGVIGMLPVQPAHTIVLAIRIVVAVLGMADVVAGQQHRRALRKKQRRQQSPLQRGAQCQHVGVVGGPFDAAIPAQVVLVTVAVVLAIGVIVLVVVADQVVQGKTVVRRQKIDAGVGLPSVVLEHIAGGGKTARKFAQRGALPQPEITHRVAVLIVPLKPAGGKIAKLIATRPDVPRFGDQFDVRQHRVLP